MWVRGPQYWETRSGGCVLWEMLLQNWRSRRNWIIKFEKSKDQRKPVRNHTGTIAIKGSKSLEQHSDPCPRLGLQEPDIRHMPIYPGKKTLDFFFLTMEAARNRHCVLPVRALPALLHSLHSCTPTPPLPPCSP